jgi:nicotinate-nucleotide adenylyltransferase
MESLQFDSVLYVPAFQSPLKQSTPTSEMHRVAMLELALTDCPWADISTIELDRGGTSYTIDTIESLLGAHDELRLLLGADQWVQFKDWHRWEDILTLANPVIMPREGFDVSNKRLLDICPLPATSTTVRERVFRGENVEDLVPPEVATYIAQHDLYL